MANCPAAWLMARCSIKTSSHTSMHSSASRRSRDSMCVSTLVPVTAVGSSTSKRIDSSRSCKGEGGKSSMVKRAKFKVQGAKFNGHESAPSTITIAP